MNTNPHALTPLARAVGAAPVATAVEQPRSSCVAADLARSAAATRFPSDAMTRVTTCGAAIPTCGAAFFFS